MSEPRVLANTLLGQMMYGHLVIHIFLYWLPVWQSAFHLFQWPWKRQEIIHVRNFTFPQVALFKCMQQTGIFPIFFIPPQSTIPSHKTEWKKNGILFYPRIQKIKTDTESHQANVAGEILREENYFLVDSTFHCKLKNLVGFLIERRGSVLVEHATLSPSLGGVFGLGLEEHRSR